MGRSVPAPGASGGTDTVVELRVPARAEHLGLVRLVVTQVAEQVGGFTGTRTDDLRLAVTEACANAVEAYGRLGRAGAVAISVAAAPGRIEVAVHDDAGGFDPEHLVPHPPVDTPERLEHERGLGVPLMRALTDALDFRPDGDGTTVVLTLATPTPVA